ncbi:hypothetical protein NNC19_14600 [Clostridium sp. SHJSY1]|uniref:hypothetical protein n=1 Tax=Clostridium sp. SHJSY1 TaxID=2942483 RepID=UPI002875A0D2|nr:hypothetical protein [Clostridium sp. SHJSY1]MDS0526919.1 hypothetical protein [Clostridium sp. SHJSY1]
MKKKLISIISVIIVLLSTLFMVSCAPSKSDYEGNWIAISEEDVEISISIDSNNKASIALIGDDGTLDGKFENGKITFPALEENLSITYENGEINFQGFGGYSEAFKFKKK